MRYELISPESARSLEGFLPGFVLEDPDFSEYLFYAAIGDDGGAVGVAAVDPVTDAPELLSIGISSEYTGKGYGSGLLSAIIKDLFERIGEERLLSATFNLTPSGWEKVMPFFINNGFVIGEDSPVYHLKLKDALDSPALKGKTGLKGIMSLKDVPDRILRLFNNKISTLGYGIRVNKTVQDPDVSVLYVKDERIVSCALFNRVSDELLQNIWVYEDPEYTGDSTLGALLSEAASNASKKYQPDTVVSFMPVRDESRELFNMILPEMEPVSYIRTLTKMLTADNAERRSEPVFEEFSEKSMCCADCARSMGNVLQCEVYLRKPDAVTDGEGCLYFEER